MRLVSLTCSNTEIVCALGRQDWLVGVDDHSDFPAEVVDSLPRVGKDLNVDPKRVAALKPDLILASLTVPGHDKVVASLQALGLPMEVFQPLSLEDTFDDIRRIGALLDASKKAEALVAEMQARIESVRAEAKNRPKVLVEWWPKPVIGAAQKSWVHDMLHIAGADNVLGNRVCESTPITHDEAVSLAPDIVVISWCGVPDSHYRPSVVYGRAEWGEIPAIRHQQVYCISEAFLGRPGPRVVEGIEALHRCVQQYRATVSP